MVGIGGHSATRNRRIFAFILDRKSIAHDVRNLGAADRQKWPRARARSSFHLGAGQPITRIHHGTVLEEQRRSDETPLQGCAREVPCFQSSFKRCGSAQNACNRTSLRFSASTDRRVDFPNQVRRETPPPTFGRRHAPAPIRAPRVSKDRTLRSSTCCRHSHSHRIINRHGPVTKWWNEAPAELFYRRRIDPPQRMRRVGSTVTLGDKIGITVRLIARLPSSNVFNRLKLSPAKGTEQYGVPRQVVRLTCLFVPTRCEHQWTCSVKSFERAVVAAEIPLELLAAWNSEYHGVPSFLKLSHAD